MTGFMGTQEAIRDRIAEDNGVTLGEIDEQVIEPSEHDEDEKAALWITARALLEGPHRYNLRQELLRMGARGKESVGTD